MSPDPDRNAAIWYSVDGYEPEQKGINGRRVAGASMLRGLLRHAQADEVVLVTGGDADMALLDRIRAEWRPGGRMRCVSRYRPLSYAPVGTLFYPSPTVSDELWRRAPFGTGLYSICGMTHTTATQAVMRAVHEMRVSPQEEWDGLICTSHAVQASILTQMDMIDDYLRMRFGAVPPRPQTPVIPLGIHTSEFAPDPALRSSLRQRLGLGEGDILCAIIARLNANVKFDPLPVYMAMEAAARQLGPGQRLHLVMCGVFIEKMPGDTEFDQGAAALMPGVGYSRLDGADATERLAALSAADIFLFPIDNVQETFGLAPIEAMAAGLPVITSDWDGMKDTVTPDVGIRVPTRTLGAEHAVMDGFRYLTGMDGYVNYSARLSAMTSIDQPALTRAIVDLARDPERRRAMGAAASRRAKTLYDWAAVVPQMQDFWADLAARRRAGQGRARTYDAGRLPVGPSPTALFAAYPTVSGGYGTERFLAQSDRPMPADLFRLRGYSSPRRPFETLERVDRVLAAIVARPEGATADDIGAATGLPPLAVHRCLIWLVKYDLARAAGR